MPEKHKTKEDRAQEKERAWREKEENVKITQELKAKERGRVAREHERDETERLKVSVAYEMTEA